MASSSDAAPILVALFLVTLLWGAAWVEVPTALGIGLLVVAGLATALLCLWTRRRAAAVVGVACVAAIALFVIDVLVLERRALLVTNRTDFVVEPPDTLTLLDFNVLHGYSEFPQQEARAERTIAAIAALDPDVIVLQEAWRTRRHGDFVERLGEALGMNGAFARANGSLERIGFEEGEAILSRYPIVQATRTQLRPRKPFFERRVALACVVDLGGGETLTVVGTHLDHRDPATADSQAAHVVDWIDPLRGPIVAGDLNAPSGSRAVALFEQLGFIDLLPGGIDHVLFPASSPWQVERVDWTLRPDDLEELLGFKAEISDHPGIVVELRRARRPAGAR